MHNDTIRPGVTIGIPGSDQRIDDLRLFYAANNKVSPFDPTIAVSYAAERITTKLPPVAWVYTNKRLAIAVDW